MRGASGVRVMSTSERYVSGQGAGLARQASASQRDGNTALVLSAQRLMRAAAQELSDNGTRPRQRQRIPLRVVRVGHSGTFASRRIRRRQHFVPLGVRRARTRAWRAPDPRAVRRLHEGIQSNRVAEEEGGVIELIRDAARVAEDRIVVEGLWTGTQQRHAGDQMRRRVVGVGRANGASARILLPVATTRGGVDPERGRIPFRISDRRHRVPDGIPRVRRGRERASGRQRRFREDVAARVVRCVHDIAVGGRRARDQQREARVGRTAANMDRARTRAENGARAAGTSTRRIDNSVHALSGTRGALATGGSKTRRNAGATSARRAARTRCFAGIRGDGDARVVVQSAAS